MINFVLNICHAIFAIETDVAFGILIIFVIVVLVKIITD